MTDTWQRSAERLLDVLRGLIAARQPLINHVGPVPEMVA
jgi:hypothetical protein